MTPKTWRLRQPAKCDPPRPMMCQLAAEVSRGRASVGLGCHPLWAPLERQELWVPGRENKQEWCVARGPSLASLWLQNGMFWNVHGHCVCFCVCVCQFWEWWQRHHVALPRVPAEPILA